MSDFVNNHGNQTVFRLRRVSSVRSRARSVKTNHRVFHSADRTVDRDCNRIRISKCVARIDVQRVNNRLRRIFFPERISLVRIIRHRRHFISADVMTLCVPDKLSRRANAKSRTFRFVNPVSFRSVCSIFAFASSWYNFQRFFRCSAGASAEPILFLRLAADLQNAGRSDDVIVRRGNLTK